MYRKFLYLSFGMYLLLPGWLLAQEATSRLSGKVLSTSGEALPGITVLLRGTSRGAATDLKGYFEIASVPPGHYSLHISGIGYDTLNKEIKLMAGEEHFIDIRLREGTRQMDEIVVLGKNEAQIKSEDGFQANVIDTRGLQNSSANLNQVLVRQSGINIRQKGGMGADFDLSLNGLSGRQARFFIDGLPMDNYGSALRLNNIPVNLIDRVEVYKGVVPVYLGSDALGPGWCSQHHHQANYC